MEQPPRTEQRLERIDRLRRFVGHVLPFTDPVVEKTTILTIPDDGLSYVWIQREVKTRRSGRHSHRDHWPDWAAGKILLPSVEWHPFWPRESDFESQEAYETWRAGMVACFETPASPNLLEPTEGTSKVK